MASSIMLEASGVITGAGGNTAILTPTSGNLFGLTNILLTVDVAGIITLYDETNASGSRVVYAYLSSGVAIAAPRYVAGNEFRSAAYDNVLYANVPSGTKLYWQIHYYEV